MICLQTLMFNAVLENLSLLQTQKPIYKTDIKCHVVKVAIPSGILDKKLKCPEFWHPLNYYSELGHENCMSDFGAKIEKSESDS